MISLSLSDKTDLANASVECAMHCAYLIDPCKKVVKSGNFDLFAKRLISVFSPRELFNIL